MPLIVLAHLRSILHIELRTKAIFCKYRVGQIKRGQLAFSLVTIDAFIKLNDFGGYKLHKTTSDMMPILS